jgi:hypothetical protein
VAYRRRTSPGPSIAPLAGGALVVVLVAGFAWWWLARDDGSSDDWAPSDFDTADSVETGSAEGPPPPLDLPPLDASDEVVRRLVSGLSAHPRMASFLVGDDMIRRFARAVADLAGASYPGEHLPALRPGEPFQVREEGGRLFVAEASHARYDALAATFASLDLAGTVRLYRQLEPLLEEAWAEMGTPGSFHDALELAAANLVAVQVPPGPLEVVGEDAIYMYRDEALEARRGAAKALIRMGPANAALVQDQLRRFQAALR